MPERPGGKPMPVGGSGANYSGGTHSRSYNPGAGGVVQHGGGNKQTRSTGNGTKGTISRGDVKNISLAGSVATKNPVGVAINLLSRLVKRKSKPPRGHPETIAKSRIKRPPPIDRDGDGPGPQMAATSAQAAQPIKPKIPPYKPYYMGFDFQKPIDTATHRPLPMKSGGLSGGKRFGPPPKKGPDPHGKCPFRPDGIRGVGAVEKGRGVKFIGTK